MDWDGIPVVLKERYEKISGLKVGMLKTAILEEINRNPMPVVTGENTASYEIFANEFNAIMLIAHIFENLMAFEDRRFEQEGYLDFQINIPEIYFRHPSLNHTSTISANETKGIAEVVDKTKKKLNYSKDQSFVLSQLHKLEFISVYSHLEAYIESLLVEVLGVEKSKAAARVRKEALPVTMTNVFNEIDVDIVKTINGFDDEALKFIAFCHKLRNLHTHNLGVVTEYFYKDCIDNDFLCHDIYAETSKPVLDYAKLKFQYSDYIFKVGKTINLTVMSQPFRLLAREIVFISDVFCQKKLGRVLA